MTGGIVAFALVLALYCLSHLRWIKKKAAVPDIQRQDNNRPYRPLNIVALIPAHNEELDIPDTLWALKRQSRMPNQIVAVPNGCSDNTAEVARSIPGIEVLELPKLKGGKSEALNVAWRKYGQEADIIICLDADTTLPPNAIKDWEQEFLADMHKEPTPKRDMFAVIASSIKSRSLRPIINDWKIKHNNLPLGGSSSKFTMQGKDFLTRLQRNEFAKWTDTALARGSTTVLAGTGCAISGKALLQVVESTGRPGPWNLHSQVEDFELTYQIRRLGYRCHVSPTVRAYTDSMKTVKALWGQRMKWQVGTVEDLLSIGVNRLTLLDWRQQLIGIFMAIIRFSWLALIIALALTDLLRPQLLWWVIMPAAFTIGEIYSALRIPHRDKMDVAHALLIVPSEVFAWLRSGWFIAAWIEVLVSKMTGKRKDRWQMQYAAETRKG